MNESDFLAGRRVAILGLGLIGGSLALALRGHCRELLASDPDPATIALAVGQGVVDHISPDPAEILPQADLIVLAAPVGAILGLIKQLPDLHPGSPVVLDVGSTKVKICQALEALPQRFDPIGGHPMCGKETFSLEHAEAGLFRGATFALAPLKRTSETARSLAEELARFLGCHTVWLEPAIHDAWAAATSHLPYLLAHALSLATPLEASSLVGPGFRSTSRLASSYSPMMLDVLATNRDPLLEAIWRFRSQLDLLEKCLGEQDLAALNDAILHSVEMNRALIAGYPAGGLHEPGG
jgi:prephenate dehydrogenase